ncbi:hypothetical protein DM01DRAFT_1406936 [Hesseltinella vesiculosa]|uniref:Flavodoxin-like domain-containing protein n=1 Tax=Hesseltinella vesiculosa TaxID=101127 RepID=A0A1X2GKD2_9FUNG|nr:hypothetical protein DM01DRAFT_1406936 [Hesseltinella vesiculosa]
MAPKVNIIIYSLYHHIYTLAKSVEAGLKEAGVEVKILQVAETLPEDLLKNVLHAPERPDVPIATIADLEEADGVIFGLPTRFGQVIDRFRLSFDFTFYR